MHRLALRLASRALSSAGLALLLFASRPVLAASPDDNWSNEFGVPGVTGTVMALVNFQGSLIVGGALGDADGVPVKNVVQLTGGQFVPMGAGFNQAVRSLAVANGVLYAAGDFDSSGTTPLPHVARWNGSAWVAVGIGGPDVASPLALAADGTNLLLLGAFSSIGAVPAPRVAVWNGTAWSTLGSCPLGTAYGATRYGTDLVVGGISAGPTSSLVRWNGSAWSEMTGVFDENMFTYPTITHVAAIGSTLYIKGGFTQFDIGPVFGLAQYNGSTWSSLADVEPDDEIENMFVDSGQLIITGLFSSTPGSHAARWNGSSWSPLGFGLAPGGGDVLAAARVGGTLYFGGVFGNVLDGTPAYRTSVNIVTWNGTNYGPVTTRGAGILGSEVEALGTYGGRLIAGGTFLQTVDNNGPLDNIAAWDGSHWTALGGGLPGFALATSMANWNGQLVVAGYIPTAGSVAAGGIAAWDGSAWHDFAGGFAGQEVEKVAVVGTTLYAAAAYGGLGSATTGGAPMGRVARWSGTQWQSIATTTGGPTTGEVSIVSWNGQLALGGSFTSVGAVPANNVAVWNGTTWAPLGNGFDSYVTALGVHNNELYASGPFTASGATPLPGRIARWNGSAWVAVGAGFNGVAFDLMSFGGKLYAAGNFSASGSTVLNFIATWDGSVWAPLGSGINTGYGRVLTNWAGGVYTGGTIDRAGGKRAINIAHWTPPSTTATPPVAVLEPSTLALSAAWPNPSREGIQAVLRLGTPALVSARVLDSSGRLVRVLASRQMEAGTRSLRWDGRGASGAEAAAGIYWLQVRAGGQTASVRVAIVR